MDKPSELSDQVAVTRNRLHQIAHILQSQERLLLDLAGLLPADSGTEDLDEMEEHVELRAVIQCVVRDCLRPAIEDLKAAAGPPDPGQE